MWRRDLLFSKRLKKNRLAVHRFYLHGDKSFSLEPKTRRKSQDSSDSRKSFVLKNHGDGGVKVYSENNPGTSEKTPKKDFSKVSKIETWILYAGIWGFYRKVY